MKKEVILLRGVSGSGKSTHSAKLISGLSSGETSRIVSADHWFERTGKYQFNPGELPMAHMSSQKAFEKALRDGINLVIVDNTNLAQWEMQPYINMAKTYGYDWSIHQLETLNPQNTHGVPDDKVQQMKAKMERETKKLPTEWLNKITVYNR